MGIGVWCLDTLDKVSFNPCADDFGHLALHTSPWISAGPGCHVPRLGLSRAFKA